MIPVPSLPQALDAGLREEEKHDSRDNSVLHVSDLSVAIGEGCPRALWLRLRSAEKKDLTQGQLLMFRHGHRIHADLVGILKNSLNSGWQIQAVEKPVALGPVVGRYDTRLFHSKEGWEIIVDFKSVRGRKFQYLDEAMPGHVLQVQSYIAAADADGGLVFYVDREGQNQARQFYVQRDDQAVWFAVEECVKIRDSEIAPAILQPKLTIGKNKGPDSVKLGQPWQCDYCDYLDISCPGALPKDYRNLGIVGYVDNSNFKPKVKDEEVVRIAERLLAPEPLPF
jgi:hypothetical protein